MTQPLRVGVLASGSGTNLQALLDTVHGREAMIVAVGSDKPDARALARARAAGVLVRVFAVDEHGSREARDAAMADWLAESGAQLVVLAGYMRLLSPAFLRRFPDRVVNVHPALLPAFPGTGAIAQAVDYGVKVFGVTVHLVDAVHDALRPLEHRLLPEAVRLFARGAIRRDPVRPRRVLVDA